MYRSNPHGSYMGRKDSDYLHLTFTNPPNVGKYTIPVPWILYMGRKDSSPGDSMWPFHPLVGGHLTIWKGYLTIPKRSRLESPGRYVSFFFCAKRPNKDLEALFSTCNIEVATSRREHSNIHIQPGGLFGCRDTVDGWSFLVPLIGGIGTI